MFPGSKPDFSALRPSKTTGYGVAVDKKGKTHVAILTDDMRARVDFHGDLSDLILYEAEWDDPKNPWAGGRHYGKVLKGYRFDYT